MEHIQFPTGYRAIGFLSTTDVTKALTQRFLETISNFLAQRNIHYFLGSCFGRYECVLDFSHASGKVASHYMSEIQEQIGEQVGTTSCCSLVLAKETFIFPRPAVRAPESSIRSYSFVKARNQIPPFRELSGSVKSHWDGRIDSVAYLWNASGDPIIMVCDGQNGQSLMETIRELRMETDDLISEGSTILSLKVGARDEETTNINTAIVYVKLRHFEELDIPSETRDLKWFDNYVNPTDRIGWFDRCLAVNYRSLRQLDDTILYFRDRNRERILDTSTLLLWGRKIGKKRQGDEQSAKYVEQLSSALHKILRDR